MIICLQYVLIKVMDEMSSYWLIGQVQYKCLGGRYSNHDIGL